MPFLLHEPRNAEFSLSSGGPLAGVQCGECWAPGSGLGCPLGAGRHARHVRPRMCCRAGAPGLKARGRRSAPTAWARQPLPWRTMRRQSSLKQRKDQTSGENGTDWADPADGERLVHEDHILLDVWSIKQGALRLQTMPFAVVLVAIMGLYFCIGAILNYNEIDADQVADPAPASPPLHALLKCPSRGADITSNPVAEGHGYQHAHHAAWPHGRARGDRIAQRRASPRSTAQHSTSQHRTAPHRTAPRRAAPRR